MFSIQCFCFFFHYILLGEDRAFEYCLMVCNMLVCVLYVRTFICVIIALHCNIVHYKHRRLIFSLFLVHLIFLLLFIHLLYSYTKSYLLGQNAKIEIFEIGQIEKCRDCGFFLNFTFIFCAFCLLQLNSLED